MSLIDDISLEIQMKIAQFLQLRPQLNDAKQYVSKFPALQNEIEVLSAEIEAGENALMVFIPKMTAFKKTPPSITQLPSIIKHANNMNKMIDAETKKTATLLTKISNATGVKLNIPKATAILNINTTALYVVGGGIVLGLIANFIGRGKK